MVSGGSFDASFFRGVLSSITTLRLGDGTRFRYFLLKDSVSSTTTTLGAGVGGRWEIFFLGLSNCTSKLFAGGRWETFSFLGMSNCTSKLLVFFSPAPPKPSDRENPVDAEDWSFPGASKAYALLTPMGGINVLSLLRSTAPALTARAPRLAAAPLIIPPNMVSLLLFNFLFFIFIFPNDCFVSCLVVESSINFLRILSSRRSASCANDSKSERRA
mmetsp:Transcript_5134/g.11162  ORF Transcript_5134/g.11162 Transcript_5134/m.11162 type:complete len:216 (-) Transcript_5134:613-1260(-)